MVITFEPGALPDLDFFVRGFGFGFGAG